MAAHSATTAAQLPEVGWRISSRSGNGGGNCVEAGPVLDDSGRVAVRHSRRPDGDVLLYGCAQWAAFLTDVKTGRFELRP